jgi:hypothetical protein
MGGFMGREGAVDWGCAPLPHATALWDPGVVHSLLNILGIKVGVFLKELLARNVLSNLFDDDRDRDPHSADAGAAAQDLRVKGDSIKGRHSYTLSQIGVENEES